MVLPLSQHRLLDSGDCRVIANRVYALRDHWTQRSGNGFFSLGTAAYLDGRAGHASYLKAAATTNAVVRDHFSDLHALLLGFFRDFLDEDAELDTRCAVPGFHVFVLSGEGRGDDKPARRAHYDMQWKLAYPGVRPEATLSFTLAIELPAGGAGLAYWPVQHDSLGSDSGDSISALAEPRTIAYLQGGLVIHDGMTLHAIGTSGQPASGTRMTLQGHGIRKGGRWLFYW